MILHLKCKKFDTHPDIFVVPVFPKDIPIFKHCADGYPYFSKSKYTDYLKPVLEHHLKSGDSIQLDEGDLNERIKNSFS